MRVLVISDSFLLQAIFAALAIPVKGIHRSSKNHEAWCLNCVRAANYYDIHKALYLFGSCWFDQFRISHMCDLCQTFMLCNILTSCTCVHAGCPDTLRVGRSSAHCHPKCKCVSLLPSGHHHQHAIILLWTNHQTFIWTQGISTTQQTFQNFKTCFNKAFDNQRHLPGLLEYGQKWQSSKYWIGAGILNTTTGGPQMLHRA